MLKQTNQFIGNTLQRIKDKKNEETRKEVMAVVGRDLALTMAPLLKEMAIEISNSIKQTQLKAQVSIPPIHIPEIKAPTVKVPAIKVPTPQVTVKAPEVKMPKEMKVKGMEELVENINEALKKPEVNNGEQPLRVILTDQKGIEYKAGSGMITGGGGGIVSTRPKNEVPLGFEQLAIADTAIGLADIPDKATKAVMTVEDATLRYRDDGTDPTATVGLKVFIGGVITLNSRSSIMGFKSIRTGASSSEVNVAYYEVD